MNRTQLTEALADLLNGPTHIDHVTRNMVLIEAARLLLDFPTDEMVEAAARHYHAEVGRRSGVDMAWETSYDSEQADFLRVTSDALEAVRRLIFEEEQ